MKIIFPLKKKKTQVYLNEHFFKDSEKGFFKNVHKNSLEGPNYIKFTHDYFQMLYKKIGVCITI